MNLPYSIRVLKRGGKDRQCVIEHYTFPSGRMLNAGRIIFMSI